MAVEHNFGGYATKAGLRCSDGRVIQPQAFQHMDGMKVPLVYMHGHTEMENVLGHAILEARPDGIYARGYFNSSPNGLHAKAAVEHGDLDSLSIYATGLKEISKVVSHGNIKELSLVLSGANPGAKIDQVRIQHSSDPDDFTEIADEAIVYTGLELTVIDADGHVAHADTDVEHADAAVEDDSEETVQQIIDSMTDKQQIVLNFVVGQAVEEATGAGNTPPADAPPATAAHTEETDEGDLAHQEGNTDVRNTFENAGVAAITGTDSGGQHTISHADIQGIFADGVKRSSFKEAINDYVLQHGITNIEVLFPDATALSNTPEFDKRRTEWVSVVLEDTSKNPFSRIKTLVADLTQDAARAKGYIKGNYKIEEWVGVTKRSTGPTTVYKKQKLDRDDILDITSFNVVAWLMGEMRLMLEEEIARAVLIGDGRATEDVDHIKDPLGVSDGVGIRSILNDHEYYVTTVYVNLADANSDYEEVVDRVMDGFEYYKGTGTPTLYTTIKRLNMFKKAKNLNGDRYYKDNAAVAAALGVSRIVTVEPMNEVAGLIGIIVNLADYTIGTDEGGQITSFDHFDIDYNQEKYLLETRLSGALTRIKTAIVIRETAAANVLIKPNMPTFDKVTGVVTIPSQTGVVYKNDAGSTLTAGAQTALAAGQTARIYSSPVGNYYFANTAEDSWPFTRNRA